MEKESALRRDYERRVNRAVDYITQHLAEPIALEALAREASFSPFHFHRIFGAMMGESVGAFLRRVRLERAAFELRCRPEKPVTEVALDCGFASSAVFARAFRTRFGMSASEWRSAAGNDPQQHSKNRQAPGNDAQAPVKTVRYALPWWARNPSEPIEEDMMEVKLEDMPAIRAVYVRRIGDYKTQAGRAWEAMCRWAGPRGLLKPDAMLFSISHNDPDITASDRLRYDACIAVGPDVKPEDEVGLVEIPARRVARARYEGPGSGIHGAWRAFYGEWLPESGFVPADSPAIEIYRSDLGNQPERDHFVMDICVPVLPA